MKDTLNIPMVCTDHIYLVQQSPSNLTFILWTASPKAGSETRVIYNQRIFLPPLLISISDHNIPRVICNNLLHLSCSSGANEPGNIKPKPLLSTNAPLAAGKKQRYIIIIILILSSYSNFLDSVRSGSLAGAAESS